MRLWAVAIFAAAIALYFTNLGKTPLRINAEIRCYQIVHNMLTSGNYLVPNLDDEPGRVNKPPLFYWASVAASKVGGGFTLTTFRIPGGFCAIGVLLVMLAWGCVLGSPRQGLLAAAFLAMTYMFILQARRGSFEMMLTFFSSLSLLACYCLARAPSYRMAFVAAVAFGLGFLTKATPILLFVPLPVAVWLIMAHRGKDLLKWQVWAFSLLAILVGISWYIAIFARPDLRQTVISEMLLPFGVKVQAVKSTAEHKEPMWFFLVQIWRIAFPISLLIPLVGFHVWKKRFYPADSGWRLLFVAFAVAFVVFSIIPQKQDHYLLPALPVLALLAADAAIWAAEALTAKARLLLTVPLALLGTVGLVLAVILTVGFRMVGDLPLWFSILIGLLQAGLSVGLFVAIRNSTWRRAAVLAFAVFALPMWGYFGTVKPVEDAFGSGEMFSRPGFNRQAWDAKFKRVPLLERLLDVQRGERHVTKGKVYDSGS